MGRKTRQRFDVESRPDIDRYGVNPSLSWILDPAAGDSPSFLVSVVMPDRPGLLRAILHEARRERPDAPDGPYTVTSSLSASHSDVGILAIVVRSMRAASPPGVNGDRTACAWSSGARLKRRLERRLADVVGVDRPRPELRVEPLGGENEQALFGNRAFGEMRFGPLVTDQSTSEAVAGAIARTLSRFADALRDVDAPIAFFDIGHRWRPVPSEGHADHPDGLWMRVAYGLPAVPGAHLRIELAAADVATVEGVDAWVDMPDADDPETLRFVPVVTRDHDDNTDDDITGATQCVVIEGLARTGFVATVLGAAQRHLGAQQLLIFGGSAMVLHGRSIVALLTDDAGAEALRVGNRHAEQQIGGFRDVRVAASSESAPARLAPRGTPETFWVSWSRSERPGVILEVLESVGASLRESGVDVEPNIVFAVSRELRLADSCTGKAKFHLPGLGESEVLFEAIRSALASGDDPWRGGDAVKVTRHEPTRRPWAALDRPVQEEEEPEGPLSLFAGDGR
jgi:hypothetical protein